MKTYSREQLREMIPLYLNGSLNEQEADDFMAGIEQDEALQNEFDEFVELDASYQRLPMPDDQGFDRLFERIDGSSRPRSSIHRQNITRFGRILDHLREWFGRPLLSWGVVIAQFAVIAIIVMQPSAKQAVVYHTLSDGEQQTRSGAQRSERINIVFNAQANIAQLNELLDTHQLNIVSGPSRNQVFVVSSLQPVNKQLLDELRASAVVQFAEKSL